MLASESFFGLYDDAYQALDNNRSTVSCNGDTGGGGVAGAAGACPHPHCLCVAAGADGPCCLAGPYGVPFNVITLTTFEVFCPTST